MNAAEALAIIDRLGLREHIESIDLPPLDDEQRDALRAVFARAARTNGEAQPEPTRRRKAKAS